MQPRNQRIVRKYCRLMIALAVAMLLGFGDTALEAQLAEAGFARHLTGELVAETRNPAPGDTVMLAFDMKPDPGWHGYWENPGDAGLGMTAAWTLPEGVIAGTLQYPVPATLFVAGLMNHVYERDYAILVPLTIPRGLAKGTAIPVRVKASALVCDDKVCIPQDFTLGTDLVIGDGTIAAAERARFDRWRAKLPQGLGSIARFARENGLIRIAIPLPADVDLSAPHLFAKTDDMVDYAATQRFTRKDDVLVAELRQGQAPLPEAGNEAVRASPLELVLKIAPDRGLFFTARPGTAQDIPKDGTPVAEGASQNHGFDAKLLLLSLVGAIGGGLLLNIMPCVFPILSLKAIGLARSGGAAPAVRRDAWAYAGGVVAVCLALGAGILILRGAGAQVGWAFQLQNPVIVFLLLLLVIAITANLAGLFEIAGPSIAIATAGGGHKGGQGNAFLTGALAAIVATPCTGPFMGAALGATLVLPWWAALVIFGGLGIGLALPFLLIAYSPALRARLPKPGAWMERFRRWMALPMGLTALALAWLLWRMTGTPIIALALFCGLALGLLLWVYGRRQRHGETQGTAVWLLPAMAALALVGSIAVYRAPVTSAEMSRPALDSERFSEDRLAALRGANRPVFVYFTADWCVTCKVNESAAINRAATAAAFRKGNVAVLVADWTNGDPAITRALAGHGRNSVPLYLWYQPGTAEPEILPQILTPDMLAARAKAP